MLTSKERVGLNSVLMRYAASGNEVKVAEILHKYNLDVYNNYYKSSPFISAATNGHLGVCGLLLQNGFDINKKYEDDWTLLHWAAFSGHDTAVKILLANGANPNCITKKHTPLNKARDPTCLLEFNKNPHIYSAYKCPTNIEVKIPAPVVVPDFQSDQLSGFGLNIPPHGILYTLDQIPLPALYNARGVCKVWDSILYQYIFHKVLSICKEVIRCNSTTPLLFEATFIYQGYFNNVNRRESIKPTKLVKRALEVISSNKKIALPYSLRFIVGVLVLSPMVPYTLINREVKTETQENSLGFTSSYDRTEDINWFIPLGESGLQLSGSASTGGWDAPAPVDPLKEDDRNEDEDKSTYSTSNYTYQMETPAISTTEKTSSFNCVLS